MTLTTLDINKIVLNAGTLTRIKPTPLFRELMDSIRRLGLLNPLTVTPKGNKFEIVDGAERFVAIKLLKKLNDLPRTLHKIPCHVQRHMTGAFSAPVKPLMRKDSELAADIIEAKTAGMSVRTICEDFYCKANYVETILSLKNLHPRIKYMFDRNLFTLDQAAAFAKIPNPTAQWRLLEQLGPYAKVDDILAAVDRGDTVVELPSGDTLILPSRATAQHVPTINKRAETLPLAA